MQVCAIIKLREYIYLCHPPISIRRRRNGQVFILERYVSKWDLILATDALSSSLNHSPFFFSLDTGTCFFRQLLGISNEMQTHKTQRTAVDT